MRSGGSCVVGVALKKEKRKKHISDNLVAKAAENGIELRFVDKEVPLEQQGPFVAILQKVRKPDWEQMLVEYAEAHPEVQVFDMPAATYPLRNRGSMVSFLDGGGWQFEEPSELVEPGRAPQCCRCNVPTNTTLAEGTGLAEALQQMQLAGLRFPVLAKPLWADGREGSHALAVVHTPRGLRQLVEGQAAYLQLPIMLQQYVDHGGCLFKVYVLGDTSVRVKRNSLHLPPWILRAASQHDTSAAAAEAAAAAPAAAGTAAAAAAAAAAARGSAGAATGADAADAAEAAAGQEPSAAAAPAAPGPSVAELPDLELMERVSAYPATKSWGRADTAPKGHGVPSPPAWLLQALAQRLRRKTGLSLFNFDVIVPMDLHRRRAQQSSGGQPGGQQAAANGGLQAPQPGTLGAAAAEAVAEVAAATEASAAVAAGAVAGPACGRVPAEEEPVALDLAAASAAAAAAAAEAGSSCDDGPAANGANSVSGREPAAASAGAAAAAIAAGQGQGQGQGQQVQSQGQDCCESEELLYHLIDINYFPGYEKMPNYEDYMVQFLRSICTPRQGQQQGKSLQQQQQQQQQQPAAAEVASSAAAAAGATRVAA